MTSLGVPYKTCKEEIPMPIPHKLFQKIKRREFFPTPSIKPALLKNRQGITRKESDRVMNIDVTTLNKIFADQIKRCIKVNTSRPDGIYPRNTKLVQH